MYNPSNGLGQSLSWQASAALGAMYAPLALNVSNRTITVPPLDDSRNKRSCTACIIGGSVAGGIVFLLLLTVLAFFICRRKYRCDRKAWLTNAAAEPFVAESQRYPATQFKNHFSSEARGDEILASIPREEQSRMTLGVRSISSSAQPEETSRTATTSSNNGEIVGLRQEMENLRRVVQGLQYQQEGEPPSYHEGE